MSWTEVYGVIPSRSACPDCGGPDQMFGGSLEVTCPTCDSTGWITVLQTSVFQARVRWRNDISSELAYFRTNLIGGEAGDVALIFNVSERSAVEVILSSELSYFIVNDRRVRHKTSNTGQLFGDMTFVVFCSMEGESRD